jgi:hypothetical protein
MIIIIAFMYIIMKRKVITYKLILLYFFFLLFFAHYRFQNRRMKAKKDSSLTADLLYTDEQQITQNYPTYQQPNMPHDYNGMMLVANSNHSLNDLMNINHEQQQTHLELSSFV